MKNIKKRILMLVLAALMLTSLFGAITVEAAAPKLISKEETVYLSASMKKYGDLVPIINLSETVTVTDLKSSAKNVATVETGKLDGDSYITYFPKKPGNTTISFKVKDGKKTYNFKYKLTVRKYVSPFKTFKLGSKNYVSLFKKDDFVVKPFQNGTVKLNIQVKKGWKLQEIDAYKKGSVRPKTVKNGSKINLDDLEFIQILSSDSNGEEHYVYWYANLDRFA